LNSWI